MSQTGYSGTFLTQDLGMKDGQITALSSLPSDLFDLTKAIGITKLVHLGRYRKISRDIFDFVHLFTKQAGELTKGYLCSRVSVDAKVCAVDQVRLGLSFVVCIENREELL